jgi:hypothetical protein
MKTRLVVSRAAALALMIFIPTGANAIGVEKICGGIGGIQCDAGQFCQKKAGACSILDLSGTCAKVPRFCPKHILRVCGCDAKTYNNDCERQQAMVSKNYDGPCK